MRWLDVAGAPGSGKSTICYPIWGDKSVGWDGLPPPAHWKPFLDEMTRLMGFVHDHPSFEAVLRMNDRSAKKMATVARIPRDDVFIQTGLVQRILGFGWRLTHLQRDVNLIRDALLLMPVSVGVAFLEADIDTIFDRNAAREKDPRTAHENRSFQVPLMLPAIKVAKEVLLGRGVRVIEIDTTQDIDAARYQLVEFANRKSPDTTPDGPGGEMAFLQPPPLWWRSGSGAGVPMAHRGTVGPPDECRNGDRPVEAVAG
jgi:hypothetical protein